MESSSDTLKEYVATLCDTTYPIGYVLKRPGGLIIRAIELFFARIDMYESRTQVSAAVVAVAQSAPRSFERRQFQSERERERKHPLRTLKGGLGRSRKALFKKKKCRIFP